LLEADKDASDTFKNGFNGREIAIDTIKGKSKNFNKLMNDKLQEIKTDLAVCLYAFFRGRLFPALAFEPEATLFFPALLLLLLPVFLFLLYRWLF
jgi:hypothetical protein